jgi:uncharacterized protein YndB with AHSA1/START domain
MRTPAPPDQVWRAFADPQILEQWFVDRASGSATPGDTITLYWDSFGIAAPQEVVAAVPDELLVLRSKWDVASDAPWQILEIRIAREGGETVLRLVHSGFAEGAEFEEEYDGVDSGWSIVLASLQYYLAHYWGHPKVEAVAMREVQFEWDQLRTLQRTGSGLARWLTTRGVVGDAGSPLHLVLRSGRSLTGRVLATSKSECLWSWEEVRGVVELKAYRAAGQRMLGMRVAMWDGKEELRAALQREIDEAVDRLAAEAAVS